MTDAGRHGNLPDREGDNGTIYINDPTHGDNLNEMWDTASKQPVSGGFLASLLPLSKEEKKDKSWMFARVGVVSNLERTQFNAARALQFAKHHSRVLIRWSRPLTGAAARSMDSSVRDALFEEEHGLWDYFVPGAPAVMNENLMQAMGLVNGTLCTMHSLILSESSPNDLQALLASAKPGGVVTLSKPPEFINVELTELCPVFTRCLRPSSLLDDNLVVSIPMRSSVVEFVPSSQYAAQNGIGVKVRVSGSKAKTTLLDIKQHMVELAFAVTNFKLQGNIVDRFVLRLAPCPPNTTPSIELNSLYVLASRVRRCQELRVLMADTRRGPILTNSAKITTGRVVINAWITPYNPLLLYKYVCHLNVDVCVGRHGVKYLYKYVQKNNP